MLVVYASLESARGGTQNVYCVSREFCLENGGARPWPTSREVGLSLVRETSPTCDGRDLDSSRSGSTRSRGGTILPTPQEKDR
jgi:hypothetical protein